MSLLKKVGTFLGIAGAAAGIEGSAARAADMEAGHHETAQTAHVEKYVSPERTFLNAKQAVIDSMNESTFDATSGGKLEGEGWEAKVSQEADGTIVVAIAAGGDLKEYVVRADEVDDGKGNIKTVYSMSSGIDRSEERAMAGARAELDAAKSKGGKGGPVASR